MIYIMNINKISKKYINNIYFIPMIKILKVN